MASAAEPELPLFRFPMLDALPAIVHGISTRHGGVSAGTYASLNLSLSVGDEPSAVMENRDRLAHSFGSTGDRMVTTRQVHGADVEFIEQLDHRQEHSPRADVLATNAPGILLMQRFADCVPVFVASTNPMAVAVAHAGWKGTLAGAASAAVQALEERYGAHPKTMIASIGPSIGPCCFEVGSEVSDLFAEMPGTVHAGEPRAHVDLWEANRLILERTGIPAESIELASLCTRCHSDEYFSHRAMGFPAGRFGGVIGIQP